MGGTGESGWLPGTIRARGVRAQQQGSPSRLCETGVDEAAIFGGLRTAGDQQNRDSYLTPTTNQPRSLSLY